MTTHSSSPSGSRRRRAVVAAAATLGVAVGFSGCTSGGAADSASSTPAATPVSRPPATAASGVYARVPEVVQQVGPSVLEVHAGRGVGSGVVFADNGIVVTNAHVVKDVKRVKLRLADGTMVPGKVRAVDRVTDLAVIKAKRENLPPAEFETDQPERGELVVALGAPLGFQNSVTAGVVSGLNRAVPGSARKGRALVDLIQTDAAISPGNSGGALVNTRGQVVGINEAYLPPKTGAVSIGFAIPSATVVDTVKELLADGTASHPYLGVGVRPLTPRIVQTLNIEADRGVLVVAVDENGPAADAGVQPGDVITRFDQQRTTSVEKVLGARRDVEPGDRVQMRISRDGKTRTLTVRVGKREA